MVPLAKAKGAFLALAAGDALGWPQEDAAERAEQCRRHFAADRVSGRGRRRSGGRYRPYEETIAAGEYSDDTQLTLAVARSRANHGADWWKAFMQVELPRWTIYERGGGGATKRAAQAWLAGSSPWQIGQDRRGTPVLRRRRQRGGHARAAARPLPRGSGRSGRPRCMTLCVTAPRRTAIRALWSVRNGVRVRGVVAGAPEPDARLRRTAGSAD